MSMSYSFFLTYILTFEITFMLLYSATNLLECTCLELRLHLKSQPGHNGSMGMTVWTSPRSVFICWTAMRSTVSLSSLRDMALQVGTNEASSSIKLFILSLRLFSIWLWASLLTTKSPKQCYNWKKWHMIYNRLYPLIIIKKYRNALIYSTLHS